MEFAPVNLTSTAVNETAPYTAAYLAEDNSQTLINVAIAMGTLETIFFSLFLWARAIAKTMHGLNFWLIPAAYLACFGHVITISSPPSPSSMSYTSANGFRLCSQSG